MAWDLDAAAYLRRDICPRCEGGSLIDSRCSRCGAVLRGEVADRVREISRQAAALLDERHALIGRLDVISTPADAARGSAPAAARPSVAPAEARESSSSRVSLQSVLAVAGAGLLAVAVIVFRFFSLDVDLSVRQGVTAGATVFFVLAALLLHRARLPFSAEALGALALVFVGLDIAALAQVATDSLAGGSAAGWTVAAIGTAGGAGLAIVGGAVTRLRTWTWLGLVALPLVPAFLGYALGGTWAPPVGHLAAAGTAVAAALLAGRLATRLGSPLRADRKSALLVAGLALAVTVMQALALPDPVAWRRALVTAGLLAGAAVVSAVAARVEVPRAWSAATGILTTGATASLAFLLPVDALGGWLITVLAAAALAGVVIVRFVPLPKSVDPSVARGSAVATLAALSVPGATAVVLVFVASGLFADFVGMEGLVGAPLAVTLALLPVTAGLLLLDAGRAAGEERPWARAAAWPAALALTSVPWLVPATEFARPALTIVVAATIAATLARPAGRRLPVISRAPFLLAAHLLLPVAALDASRSPQFATVLGLAAAAGVIALAAAMSRRVRVVYLVAGYAYVLGVAAQAFDRAGIAVVPTIALTATLAGVIAIAVTLWRRIGARYWIAVLLVSAVPVLISVQTILVQRTWSAALASATIFALALVVATTRRPGLTTAVRAGAAALALPALATTAVNVIPRLLEFDLVPAWNGGGGAPIVLPFVAALAAVTLPAARLAADWVRGGDLSPVEGRAVQIALESSALATGFIATVLALTLETAGLATALIVLVVIGVGAASAALFAGRRYGWAVAGTAWTCASWCAWGLAGVTDLEVFLYPPALSAALVGVILILRGRGGGALVGSGLSVALATSIVVLAATGSGGAAVPVRALAVLGAGALLVAVTAVVRARSARIAALRVPLAAAAAVAATAGVVQGVRLAIGADPVAGDPGVATALVLAFSAAGAAILAGVGLLASTRGRWRLVPALTALVAAPLLTADSGVATTWILWGLMIALLAAMVVISRAGRRPGTPLPPAALVFVAAWAVGVAGWASRVLHVEWFSLALGLALLLAGALALRAAAGGDVPEFGVGSAPNSGSGAATPPPPRGGWLVRWPVGARGSWALLAPGVVVTLLPSVLATGTNPATWRAILVIALALTALLVGTLLRLAAPFVLSLGAFGVEIAVVFLSQLGRAIDPVVLWIALATAGVILLVLAVGFERRDGAGGAARLRDLR